MTKPVITTRAGKGSALTWTEGDTNLTNLRDATVTIKAGSAGTDVVSDLNGTVTLVAGTNVTLSGNNSTKEITINAAGGSGITDVVQDTTPQLGGDLDVNGKNIVSASNGNIAIMPNGSGNIQLIPTTGKITLGATDWPTTDGTANQVLKTNGTGTLSWTTISSGGITDVVQDTTPQLGGNLDVNGYSIVSASNGNIAIVPDGSGNIQLTPTSGKITLGALDFPTGMGTNGQVLTTNGSSAMTWTTISSGIASVSADTSPTLGGNLNVNGNLIRDTRGSGLSSYPTIGFGGTNTKDVTLAPGNDGTYGNVKLGAGYLKWPNADGTSNQVLKTDGAGTLSWTTISSFDPASPGAIGSTTASTGAFTDLSSTGKLTLKQPIEAIYNNGNSGAATITPNAANGSVQKYTLTGNITWNAFGTPVAGQSITMILVQDATGSRTLTSTGIKWSGASKTLSTAANSIDIATVYYDGTNYYGSLSKGFA